jgi:hypothetical protein
MVLKINGFEQIFNSTFVLNDGETAEATFTPVGSDEPVVLRFTPLPPQADSDQSIVWVQEGHATLHFRTQGWVNSRLIANPLAFGEVDGRKMHMQLARVAYTGAGLYHLSVLLGPANE